MLISAFAGLFLVWGYVSSTTLITFTHSEDLLFLLAALFTILSVVVRQSWSATLLGTITGIIFLGTPGAPFPLHITVSLIGNGLVFDAYLRLMNRRTTPPTRLHTITAATLGNLVMAVIGLSALQTVGTVLPVYLWVVFVAVGGLMGALGSLFGLTIVRRILVSSQVSSPSLRTETVPVRSEQ
jgi:hypothetical protein